MRRNSTYIWQGGEWPRLRWDATALMAALADVRHRQGRLLGQMQRLGFDLQLEAEWVATTDEVMNTSEIEGERLDLAGVRSSVARRLGVPQGGATNSDRKVDGVVEMMLDATHGYAHALTEQRLFGWQAALFPTGYSGLRRISTEGWRTDSDGPMQVVSGPIGRQRVHFEAPPAKRIAAEMKRFLTWFNGPSDTDGVLRSGIAHFWFVTLHPFEDGNGRIARAIADLALAQSERTGQRFYSMSAQILRERARYYDMLERSQKGTVDVTEWLSWFLACFGRAITLAEERSRSVLGKAEFWRRFAAEPLSARQKTVLNRFLDGFEGKLTTKKWAALGKCSVDSAQRDINDLLARGLLARNPGGSKRTSYSVVGSMAPISDAHHPARLGGSSIPPVVDHLVRTAIAERRLIRFQFDGLPRIAEPHDYGVINDVLRLFVYQVGGKSRSGRIPNWRQITLSKASDFELLEQRFPGPRPAPTGQHHRWDRLLASVSRQPFG